jgi:streptogramin lyase
VDAHNFDGVATVIARKSSRRLLLKHSIALGVGSIATGRRFGGTVLGQTTRTSTTPLGEHVIAEWDVNMPTNFAFGFGSVWVPSRRDPNVTTRIDPATNDIIAVIQGTGSRAHQALVVGDQVWVSGENNDMAPIDPKTNTVGTPVEGAYPHFDYGFDSIWAADRTDGLARIDPATSKIVASIQLGDGYVDYNSEVVVTASAVWVHHADEDELIKIDPVTNTILSTTPYQQLIADAQALTTVPPGKGTDFIWRVTKQGLLRIDPTTTTGLTYLPLTDPQMGAHWVTFNDESVWLSGIGQIARVNVASNQIDATYQVHDGYTQVGLGFGSVWVSYEDSGLVQRLDLAP